MHNKYTTVPGAHQWHLFLATYSWFRSGSLEARFGRPCPRGNLEFKIESSSDLNGKDSGFEVVVMGEVGYM